VAAIVLAAVVPDWECKSAAFIFNKQTPKESIFKIFFEFLTITSKPGLYNPKFF